MTGLRRVFLSIGLSLLLAWPCLALAMRFDVAISQAPLADDTFVRCDSLEACRDLVATASPAVQVKIVVYDAMSANALNDELLFDWYATGLNVVFGYGGTLSNRAAVKALGDLLARADGLERSFSLSCVRGGLVSDMAYNPEPDFSDSPLHHMLGPRGGFASSPGLCGWDAMPHEPPHLRMVRHQARRVARGMFGPLRLVVPSPLPGARDGLQPLMLRVLAFLPALPPPGDGVERYRVSGRAYGWRHFVAGLILDLLHHHESAQRRAAMSSSSSSSSSSSGSFPSADAGSSLTMELPVPAPGVRLSPLVRLKLMRYLSGPPDVTPGFGGPKPPPPPPPASPGLGLAMGR